MKLSELIFSSLKWGLWASVSLTIIGGVLIILAPSVGLIIFLFVGFLLVPAVLVGHSLNVYLENNSLAIIGFLVIQFLYYWGISLLILWLKQKNGRES